MKIWIDIKNSHEPLFFKSIISGLNSHSYHITTRDFAETIPLLRKYGMEFDSVCGRPEGTMLNRTGGFVQRILELFVRVPSFDYLLNHHSAHAILVSKMRRKKNITIGDNEIDHLINSRILKYVDYFLAPSAVDYRKLYRDGLKPENLKTYNGFKEDVYIADFVPDPNFLKLLPFDEFVTIRPESIQAVYVPKNTRTIVPELLKSFEKENVNVLFLPRYISDREYAKSFSNVFIPPEPLNGLDVCHNSKAVITGAGTFSREAACMGKRAISFYPGKELLGVDRKMISDGMVLHSRNVDEIVEYSLSAHSYKANLDRSKTVKLELLDILKRLIQ